MNSTVYEYALSVAKHRSISKAAQELCITQPALTKSLNRLEAELGTKLFNRSSHPITVTPSGEKFLEKAIQILDLERSLHMELCPSSSAGGTLSVGMNTEFCSNTIPYVLPAFKQLYPNIQISLCEGHNSFLFEELNHGKIDLAFAALSPNNGDFAYEILLNEAILLAVPLSHPMLHSMDLSLNSPLTPYYLKPEMIRGCDFIILIPEQGMGTIARDLFIKYNLNPNIVLEVRKHETALRLASTGMGMIFTPMQTPLRIPLVKPMAYFSIENPVFYRSRGFYYKRDIPLSDSAKRFIQVFKRVIENETALRPPVCQLLFSEKLL